VKLSVVIPARNEEDAVQETLSALIRTLRADVIPFEIILVDDGSTDETTLRVHALSVCYPELRLVQTTGRHGYGLAVRCGLQAATGDAVAIVMADGSDSPEDVVQCYRRLLEGPDCVFGSRFMRGAKVIDYPMHKLVLNRLANWFIRAIFGVRFNDFTNAFKLYRWEVIEGMQPLISPHFNLTVEMSLKAMVRGYSFAVVPIRWTNRKTGMSKLRIKEMGSRYLFIVLYLWLEKHLARGDYHRRHHAEQQPAEPNVHRI
jgi:dolichol-phosphate mannosyltransferase